MFWDSAGNCLVAEIRVLAAERAISKIGCLMLVSLGEMRLHSSELSKPTIEISSGTEIPDRCNCLIHVNATSSDQHKMAVN